MTTFEVEKHISNQHDRGSWSYLTADFHEFAKIFFGPARGKLRKNGMGWEDDELMNFPNLGGCSVTFSGTKCLNFRVGRKLRRPTLRHFLCVTSVFW